MNGKYEIIVVGYRWYWETLERTIDSILKTNKHGFKVNVGLNSPEPEMLGMIETYRDSLNIVEVSEANLNKVGMQRRLVESCTAEYVVSFDDDSFVIQRDWQDFLIERVEAYENRTLRFFGDFGDEKEAASERMTGNRVGLLGLIFYEWLDQPKREILEKCPWYDPVHKLNHNGLNPHYNKEQIWFCAGGFYVFLREPYLRFDYPGFDYKMAYEDVIVSFFYQHHGYRLGDLGGGFQDSGLNPKRRYSALGNRVIVDAGQRSFDLGTVESAEHSLDVKPYKQFYGNEYLMGVIDFLKTLPHVERHADYLNAYDYYPFLNALAKDLRATRILEVGVRFGYSAVAFIYGNPVKEYLGIDNERYDSTSAAKSLENLEYLKGVQPMDFTLLVKDSQNLTDLVFLGSKTFDFIHIDGDHSYEGALTDCKNFWNVLDVGGHMLIDDSILYSSVNSACQSFARLIEEPCYNVKSFRGTWVFLKTKETSFAISRSAVNETTRKQPIQEADIARKFTAKHVGWSGTVLLLKDGTFRGGLNSPDGRWEMDGDLLKLAWYHWPANVLKSNGSGTYHDTDPANHLTLYEFGG